MKTRKTFLVGTALVVGGVLWYLFRPDALVISKTVNEPFPAEEASEQSSGMSSQMSHATPGDDSAMGHGAMGGSSTMGAAHQAGDTASMAPAGEPERLLQGRFHSNAHKTSGVATIYRLDDGRRVLRLTGFNTSNGPDVRVYLVAAADVQEEDAVKQVGFVDLGALKGNIGDQNYDLPATLDLSRYRAVSIWCRRFSVNFGAAPLVSAM